LAAISDYRSVNGSPNKELLIPARLLVSQALSPLIFQRLSALSIGRRTRREARILARGHSAYFI
jgi:hypothetical protein